MDTNIGAKERVTQNRLIGLFKNVLKYTYLGNWETREDNANIEEKLLTAYLSRRGYTDKEIRSSIVKLKQSANSLGGGLYNANKEVYTFLRYGVNIQAEVTEKKKMVHLIDWANPMENDFQIAEEVTIQGASDRRPDLVVYVNGIALAVIEPSVVRSLPMRVFARISVINRTVIFLDSLRLYSCCLQATTRRDCTMV